MDEIVYIPFVTICYQSLPWSSVSEEFAPYKGANSFLIEDHPKSMDCHEGEYPCQSVSFHSVPYYRLCHLIRVCTVLPMVCNTATDKKTLLFRCTGGHFQGKELCHFHFYLHSQMEEFAPPEAIFFSFEIRPFFNFFFISQGRQLEVFSFHRKGEEI